VNLLSRPILQISTIALIVGTISLALSLGRGAADTVPEGPVLATELKNLSEFQSIGDVSDRSRALFAEAAKVLTHPRCINCHPVTRMPTQGDDMHPHKPFMNATESGIGAAGIACSTCHRADNTTIVGSQIRSVPGNAHWSLAPSSMAWQGLSVGEICQQLKDPKRNGNRDLAKIHSHVTEDHLVEWAWHPGEGRRPAPGTQAEFGALINAWIETGAECPS